MNKWTGWILASGILIAAAPSALLWAHEMGSGDDGHGRWEERTDHRKELGLTHDQESKLQSIREAQEKATKPLWRKERDLTIRLKDQLEDKASDAEIKTTLADLKTGREALMEQGKRFHAEMEAVLTPTQQARMLMARMHHGMQHRERPEHGEWMKSEHRSHGEAMAPADSDDEVAESETAD